MVILTQQVRGQPELHNTLSQKVKKEKEKKDNSTRALGHRKQILLSNWVTRSSERNQGPQDLQYSRKETGTAHLPSYSQGRCRAQKVPVAGHC